MEKLRIAVIGTNHMGKNWIKVLQQFFDKEAELGGVMNSRPETTLKAAKEFKVKGYANIDELKADKTDAVIVATPFNTHYQIAKELLSKKIPTLLEKPFAETDEQCFELIKIAQQNKVPLFIGHSENYNPAVIKLKEELEAPIKAIAAIRTSQNGAKNGSNVISELMIHDLAIVNELVTGELKKTIVKGKKNYNSGEYAEVQMQYDNKEQTAIKLIAINHKDCEIERKMRLIDTKNNIWEIYFNERKLLKNSQVLCEGGNSLVNEFNEFLRTTQTGEAPKTTPEDARVVVDLCKKLENKQSNNLLKTKDFQKD